MYDVSKFLFMLGLTCQRQKNTLGYFAAVFVMMKKGLRDSVLRSYETTGAASAFNVVSSVLKLFYD